MYTSLGIMATKIMYHTHISRQSVLEKKKGFQVRCLLPCQRNLAESCQHSRKLKFKNCFHFNLKSERDHAALKHVVYT